MQIFNGVVQSSTLHVRESLESVVLFCSFSLFPCDPTHGGPSSTSMIPCTLPFLLLKFPMGSPVVYSFYLSLLKRLFRLELIR